MHSKQTCMRSASRQASGGPHWLLMLSSLVTRTKRLFVYMQAVNETPFREFSPKFIDQNTETFLKTYSLPMTSLSSCESEITFTIWRSVTAYCFEKCSGWHQLTFSSMQDFLWEHPQLAGLARQLQTQLSCLLHDCNFIDAFFLFVYFCCWLSVCLVLMIVFMSVYVFPQVCT